MNYFDPDDLKQTGTQEVRARHPYTTQYLGETVMANFAGKILEESVLRLPEEEVPAVAPAKLFDIFLSYSSLDYLTVLGLFKKLTATYHKTVYVDRIGDPQLDRTRVSRKTAKVLQRRMAQCRSLFCATTDNIVKSNWVPWELGFEDGFIGKVAILPITKQQSFRGSEYFELYPEVRPDPKDLFIFDQGSCLGTWKTWISQPRTI